LSHLIENFGGGRVVFPQTRRILPAFIVERIRLAGQEGIGLECSRLLRQRQRVVYVGAPKLEHAARVLAHVK
jgi:hypothetical protein